MSPGSTQQSNTHPSHTPKSHATGMPNITT
nr:MAG TPA: hypothetical protein [Bacteriophage sp.]